MKCMKVHGAKDRNTVTFLEGTHVETLEVIKTWKQNEKI